MIGRYQILSISLVILSSFFCDKAENKQSARAYDPHKGKAVYQIHCQSCHGEEGLGDGFMGLVGQKPRNYKEEGFYYGSDFAAIRKSIEEGIVKNGMPAFGATLSEEELNAVTLYIRNTLGF